MRRSNDWSAKRVAIFGAIIAVLMGVGTTVAAHIWSSSATGTSLPGPARLGGKGAAGDVVTGPAPVRPTNSYKTSDNGTLSVTFDSMVDNPVYGDERFLCSTKPARDKDAGGFRRTVGVRPGETWLLRMYVHNDADPERTEPAHDARARVAWTVSGESITSTCFLSAQNADPPVVTSAVTYRAEGGPVRIGLVKGSARAYSNYHPHGVKLPDSIAADEGALLGGQHQDGEVIGGFYDDLTVTILVRVTGA